MTQRDWQKDMDDVRHYLKDRHSYHHAEQTLRGTPVSDILQYWLQEAKVYKQSYEGTLTAWEAEKARVKELENSRRFEFIGELRRDAAEKETLLAEEIIRLEAREQQLKEVIQEAQIVLEAKEPWPFKVLFKIRELLSTLYPDTPAPKEGSDY